MTSKVEIASRRAQMAMAAYVNVCENPRGYLLTAGTEEILTDLLTDILHYCKAKEIDVTALLQRAEKHFRTEQEEVGL